MIKKLRCARTWVYTEIDMARKIDELVWEVNELRDILDISLDLHRMSRGEEPRFTAEEVEEFLKEHYPKPSSDPPE